MRYVLNRAVHHLFGRLGEFVAASGLMIIAAFGLARIGPSAGLAGSPHTLALLAAAALSLVLIGFSIGRMLDNEEETAADPAADELDWSVPDYLADAPTFVHYSHSTKVSLTKNIRLLVTDGNRDFTFYFLQPIVTETTVVRPFGGTPRFDVVSCSERHLHIRLAEKTDVLKLAILGQIMPVIQNHPDDPVPTLGALGRITSPQPLQSALARRHLDDDLSAASFMSERSVDS
jgi:hypothetical protein